VQHGAINIYTRIVGEQRVTVLGETPAATVVQIANSLAPRGK
jgi:sigma-E factor negative regulatory protein RseB